MTTRGGDASIFGSRRIAAAARRVIAIVNAITREDAHGAFGAFFLWPKNARDVDAAFRAVQILRDLDFIDPEEAAYLFAQLLRSGPVFNSPSDDAVEYLRAHGEGEMARVIVDDLPAFHRAIERAADSLIDRKPSEQDYRRGADAPASVAVVAERVLALAASSDGPERKAAWGALMTAMRGVSVEARVRAVSRLKDVGALSRAEHATFVHELTNARYATLSQYDREGRRRLRADGVGSPVVPGPFTRRQREEPQGLPPRSLRIRAACLRQLGEHDLANLLLADTDAYFALVKEGDASMPEAAPS